MPTLLKLADAELRSKEEQIKELEAALEEKELQALQVTEETEQVRSQQYWLQARIDQLEKELSDTGRELDAKVLFPDNYQQMEEWVGRHLSARMFLASKAVRAVKNAAFEDVELVYKALLLLGREYRDMKLHGGSTRNQGFNQKLGELGLVEEPSGDSSRLKAQGEEFLVMYDGRKRLLERHLKNGGNTRDPRRCFRLYFFYDDEKHLVVVGSLPAHLTTRAT